MGAVLKNPSKGARGQVMKSSKGKLDDEIPDPPFLADPYHRVKAVDKHIFPSSTKVGISNVGASKHVLYDSRNIGGT